MSADPGIRLVIEEVVRRLQRVVPGAAHYDLSTDSAVQAGDPPLHPAQLPQVWVAPGPCRSTPGPVLGHRTRTLQVYLVGFVGQPEGTSSSGDRSLAGADLADDIAQALELDPSLGLARFLHGIDLEIEVEAFDGDPLGRGHYGICECILTVTWLANRGI